MDKLFGGENIPEADELTSMPPILSTKRSKITESDIKVGENQPVEAKEELLRILNEYRDCITMSIEEIGCTDYVEREIKEIPGSKPVARKPYSASNTEREKIKAIVDECKKLGIVTKTESAYASPVLLVKRKTGPDRLVVNYRSLNRQTEKINFPLPNMDI